MNRVKQLKFDLTWIQKISELCRKGPIKLTPQVITIPSNSKKAAVLIPLL